MTESNSRMRATQDDPRNELLSRAYREAVENDAGVPSVSVDDAIRAAARRAAEPAIMAAFRRWRTPLALAATLLLAIGIALRIHNPGEMRSILPPVPAKDEVIQEKTDTRIEDAKPQSNVEEARKTHENSGPRRSGDAARFTTNRPAPAGDATEKPAIPRDEGLRLEEQTGGLDRQKETPPAPQSEAIERLEVQPTPAPLHSAPRAFPAPPPPPKAGAASRTAVPFQNPAPAAPSLSGSAPRARTEEQKAAAAPLTGSDSLAQHLDARPAEEWIEQIRTLKRAGRGAEASELLTAFRKKFPGLALPDDLKNDIK